MLMFVNTLKACRKQVVLSIITDSVLQAHCQLLIAICHNQLVHSLDIQLFPQNTFKQYFNLDFLCKHGKHFVVECCTHEAHHKQNIVTWGHCGSTTDFYYQDTVTAFTQYVTGTQRIVEVCFSAVYFLPALDLLSILHVAYIQSLLPVWLSVSQYRFAQISLVFIKLVFLTFP